MANDKQVYRIGVRKVVYGDIYVIASSPEEAMQYADDCDGKFDNEYVMGQNEFPEEWETVGGAKEDNSTEYFDCINYEDFDEKELENDD